MGVHGEIRGKSKIAAYLRYKEFAQDDSWDWHPRNKKEAKKAMVWDPQAEEWVLRFYAAK